MEKAKMKSVSFDSTDVITASTPEVFNNGLFTFSGFDNTKKNDGLIEGDWDNIHYEFTRDNYESLFTRNTTVEGGFKSNLTLNEFIGCDAYGISIYSVYNAYGDGEFIFDGTSFSRKQ